MWREYLLDSSELQAVDMLALTTEDERLAFFLNLYNLIVMHGLVVLGPPADSMERIVFYKVCGGYEAWAHRGDGWLRPAMLLCPSSVDNS